MPRKRWNALSVPAFVTALATVAAGLLTTATALVLGGVLLTLLLAGLSIRRIRVKDQAGKGFAIAALVVGVFAAVLTAITIAAYGVL